MDTGCRTGLLGDRDEFISLNTRTLDLCVVEFLALNHLSGEARSDGNRFLILKFSSPFCELLVFNSCFFKH